MTTSLDSKPTTLGVQWRRQNVSQRVLLGEYEVLKPAFDAIVTDTNFLHMPPELGHEPPLQEMQQHGVDVAAVNSCPVGEPLPKWERTNGCYRYVTNQYKHYYVRLDGTFDDYMAAFSSKTRSTLLRKVRRFAKLSQGDYFKVYRSPEEMDEFVNLAREVAEKTFQEALFGYGLPDTPEFRAQIGERAREGDVEGYILFAEGKPVAYIHGPITAGSIILYDHVGYDPDYRKYSPGTVLQYHVIEHLFEDGRLAVYDLCTGEGEHKRLFANADAFCVDLYYFRPRPKYLFVFVTHAAFQKLSRAVTWTLEKLQVKSKIKRFLRGRA